MVQIKPKIENVKQRSQVLNYSATHPDAVTEYRRSGIIIHIYLDASYISEPEAQSRTGESFFIEPKYNIPIQAIPLLKGTLHV